MFGLAPGALDELRALVGVAQRQGLKLAVVYPPVYKPRFDVEQTDWEQYWRLIESVFPAETRYLNFNAPEYDGERSRFHNFQDGSHLSASYADVLVPHVAALIAD
jgi:hypothetical protein